MKRGQARCSDANCQLQVSVGGKDLPALTVLPPLPPPTAPTTLSSFVASLVQPKATEDAPLTVHLLPDFTLPPFAGLSAGAMVRVDIQAPGYEPTYESFRIGTDTEICAVLQPFRNLRVTLEGANAAGVIFASKEGSDVDRCAVDVSAGQPSCSMHVPAAAGKWTQVSVRIVGTGNAEFKTYVSKDQVTGVKLSAPRTLFTFWGDVGIGTLLAAGVGASALMVDSGEHNVRGGDLGLDVGASIVTGLTFVATYGLVMWLSSGTFHWTETLPAAAPAPVPMEKEVKGFAGLPSRHHVAVKGTPSGFALEW